MRYNNFLAIPYQQLLLFFNNNNLFSIFHAVLHHAVLHHAEGGGGYEKYLFLAIKDISIAVDFAEKGF